MEQGQVKKTKLIKRLMEKLLLLMKLILRQLKRLKGKQWSQEIIIIQQAHLRFQRQVLFN